MRIQDLHVLPKFRDGWSYLYVEHCRIDQEARAIAVHDAAGKVPVPCANLALLMLGPGVSITHAAVSALADNGSMVVWCGEEGVRLYAHGQGKTRHSRNLLRQALLWADPHSREKVVRRLYSIRFGDELDDSLTLQQIRGKEGIRVREAYAQASRDTGIAWKGRSYDRGNWSGADPVNRVLSAANSCLYGICHAGILALGLSPALGFVHSGKMLSFVYDVADLYKTDTSIPLAFRAAAQGSENLETRARHGIRDVLKEKRLLVRIVHDLHRLFDLKRERGGRDSEDFDSDAALPGSLWDPIEGEVAGGVNFGDDLMEVDL